MTVIKNQKSNTYEVRTYYKDWTGVRKQKTKRGFKRKCDAQEWERAFKLKENLSLDMYFEDFVDLYLNDIKSRIKYNTWLTKKHIVEKKILPYFSKKKLQEIKPSDIRQWQNTMMNYRNKQGEGYSQVYLKTIHNQLSAILNHAVNFYDLKSNAARKAGSMGKERTKEMLFWTKEEYLHIDFIPYVTGSKRGLDTRVSLKQALSSLGFKGGSRSETELNQWVQSEKQKLAMVMRENEIEWDQKGTHEQHLSVLDYKKKVREQEVEELTEHKNLLEHDLHDISECVDEIQKEKAQAEKERDAVIKKTEVLEKRFSALNSKAGLVDSHAREYGYYPEEWLPEAGTLESAKSYRKRIFPLVKKVANMIQALYSKYLDLKNKNQKLSDRNIDLENRVDRLREEISVIKKENVALLNVAYDMDRVVAVLGENKVKEAIEVAKHLEQVNAKQKGKKRRTDREGR